MIEERTSDPELTPLHLRMCQALAGVRSERVWEVDQRSEVVVSRTALTTLVRGAARQIESLMGS